MKSCLLIVDLQNDYFPGGAMELAGADLAAARARALLDRFRADNLPVIHVQHIAGTAWSDKARPCSPKGATGIGVRLLIEYLRNR